MRYQIEVPGKFRSGVAFLDLETVKVPTPTGYRMPNGEVLRNRWSVALAGVGRDGWISIVDAEGREEQGLIDLAVALDEAEAVLYGATREFDEMICRGRFTNARRAHLSVPTFPAVPGAEDLVWVNVAKRNAERPERGADIASREVPAGLRDGRKDAVLVHLLRDVAELILTAGEPDETSREWCSKILMDYDFALSKIF